MEIDLPANKDNSRRDARDRLNNLIAISVALLSAFMAVTKVKDDNLVQAMLQSKSDAVDTWGEYQAKKIKRHLMEVARSQSEALSLGATPDATARLREQMSGYDAEIKRYQADEGELQTRARDFEKNYDTLNYRDDQFDLSDAALSLSLGMLAVSALTGKRWLLTISWVFAGFGALMGTAGLIGLHIHPDWLTRLLS
jgi:type VI protein secretion system component VasF